jgi:hypothetical protein
LSRSISEDTHTPRRVIMMATLRGYLFTLIARRPLGLQGARGGPRAALGWAAGAGAAGRVVALELSRAGQRELEPQHTWWPRSCPGLGNGSWSCRTCGGPGAGPGWAAGAGAAGHVVALELPRAGQRELEPQDTWWPRSYPGLGSGSWSRRTRGGPGAALGYAVHAEVMDTRERVICMPHLLS